MENATKRDEPMEVWFRSPHNYIKEIAEVGEPYRIIWERGILIKKRIDPVAHAEIYLGRNSDTRIMAVGPQGCAEVGPGNGLDDPIAVYPVWDCENDDFELLEEFIANPVAENEEITEDLSIPSDERPVPGQDHVVVVINLPDMTLRPNKKLLREISDLQERNPQVTIHIHGLYAFHSMFGNAFKSVDWEPRTNAAKGRIYLGNGKGMNYEQAAAKALQWIHLMNMSVSDLKVPRNRCMFNIRSALWAAQFWNQDVKFKSKGRHNADPDAIDPVVPTTRSIRTRLSLTPTPSDKVVCDQCSLNLTCKYFRVGSVCTVPGSDSSPLAKAFNSRDASKIIDGLGTILGAQAKRLERGIEDEEVEGDINPEVSKMMNSLFANGVKLAKLIDPSLTKPMVQINNGSAAQVSGANPKTLTAAVVRSIEASGIKREDITPEMFQEMLKQMGVEEPQHVQPREIPGTVIQTRFDEDES